MKLNNIIDLNSYIRISSIRENFEENCLYIKDFDEIKNLDLHNCNNIIFENSHLKTAFFDKLNLADIDYTVNIYLGDDLVYSQSGKSLWLGYHTIKLDKTISLTSSTMQILHSSRFSCYINLLNRKQYA